MALYEVDDDLEETIWRLAKSPRFESFSSALRRVIELIPSASGAAPAEATAPAQTQTHSDEKRPSLKADEMLEELATMTDAELQTLKEAVDRKHRRRASSPSARDWAATIPELQPVQKNWQAFCDHLGIRVNGDSARRALDRWAKVNRANWPNVPNPDRD